MISHEHLMQGMTIQHLRFTVRPTEGIIFDNQPGSALRGALYQALSENFCSEPDGPQTPDHHQRCPVCWLLAAEDPERNRGRQLPRPLTVEPPEPRTYRSNEVFTFGFSLVGKAQDLLPYLARAVQKMGQIGVGKGRGRFKLTMIAEHNPLLDATRDLMHGNIVRQPTLQVTSSRITETASQGLTDRLTLQFLAPLRLTAEKSLVKKPDPAIFVQRLMERCQELATYYAETDACLPCDEWKQAAFVLQEQAALLKIAYDDTEWVESWSGSRRQKRYTPIGGLIGNVRWEGNVEQLRPWLLWGQSLHVGKNTVKGNGWYRVIG